MRGPNLRVEWESLRAAWIVAGRKPDEEPVSYRKFCEGRKAAVAPAMEPVALPPKGELHRTRNTPQTTVREIRLATPAIQPPASLSLARTVAIINDIHFPVHHRPTWNAFRAWHADAKPWMTVILGDFLDLESLSRYMKTTSTPMKVIPEIKEFCAEANALEQGTGDGGLWIVEGNHDERYTKALFGEMAYAFQDALGLSLKDQCVEHGLTPNMRWLRETSDEPVLRVGQFDLSHGHNGQSRFGGGKHLAANAIAKTMGASTVRGHNHRAQLFCQTYIDKVAISIASPCMQGKADYTVAPDWQRGFTILELDAPDYVRATPHPIVAENGRFSYGGRTYRGQVAA